MKRAIAKALRKAAERLSPTPEPKYDVSVRMSENVDSWVARNNGRSIKVYGRYVDPEAKGDWASKYIETGNALQRRLEAEGD